MNGYKGFADIYRKQLTDAAPKEKPYLEKQVKVFDIAADLSDDEAAALFDTGIFNRIYRGYIRYTLQHMSGLSDKQRDDLTADLIHILDEIDAETAINV